MNPLDHYDTYGWKEGRDPSGQYGAFDGHAAYSDGVFGLPG